MPTVDPVLREKLRLRAQRMLRALPVPVKRVGNSGMNALDPIVRRRFAVEHPGVGPLPPRELRRHGGTPNLQVHLRDGEQVFIELEVVLGRVGRPLDSFQSVVDFGCGCARIMRFVQRAVRPGTKLVGFDIDADSIAWAQRAYPEVSWVHNDPLPPFPTLDDQSVELLYAVSVFTHLDAEYQDRWLAEVSRVLAPGGIGVLTVMGETLAAWYVEGARPGISPDWQRRMKTHASVAAEGLVYEPYEAELLRSRGHGDSSARYGMTFHSPRYIHGHWSQFVDVVEIVPEAMNWQQDAVVVRRKS